MYSRAELSIMIYANVDDETEMLIKFRISYLALKLISKKIFNAIFNNQFGRRRKEIFDTSITLYKTDKISLQEKQMCTTKIVPLKNHKDYFYMLIQLDKPIYQPGDDIQFRIFVLDMDLKPFLMNMVEIKIIDSFNNDFIEFRNDEEELKGFYNNDFHLSTNVPQGNYKIVVVVDKETHLKKTLNFDVRNMNLPTFEVFITINDEHFLPNSVMDLTFFSKYPNEEFVSGNAILTITCTVNREIMLTKELLNIREVSTFKFILTDFYIQSEATVQKYDVEIVFRDTSSGNKATKTIQFFIHDNSNSKIVSIHPENFTPKLPFSLKVFVYDWKDRFVNNSNDPVKLNFFYKLKNGSKKNVAKNAYINNGVALHNLIVPYNVAEMTISVNYENAFYEKKLQMRTAAFGFSSLMIDYSPKR